MIETSSGLPRKSSAIFGNFREMFGNVRLAFGKILENLRESASENRQKRRRQYVYSKKKHCTLARRYEFYVLVARTDIVLATRT